MHHDLQDIDSVLELQDHVVVCPVAFAILTVFNEYEERRLIASEWGFFLRFQESQWLLLGRHTVFLVVGN